MCIGDHTVNLVKSTNKRPIKVGPMSVLTVSGIYKSKIVLETAVSQCVDDTKGILGVCPRVVSVKSPGKNRIPVRIFNMTTKVVYLKPKCIICGLNEVKVMRHTDLGHEPETQKTDDLYPNLEQARPIPSSLFRFHYCMQHVT